MDLNGFIGAVMDQKNLYEKDPNIPKKVKLGIGCPRKCPGEINLDNMHENVKPHYFI
jgi:hypothetical protein